MFHGLDIASSVKVAFTKMRRSLWGAPGPWHGGLSPESVPEPPEQTLACSVCILDGNPEFNHSPLPLIYYKISSELFIL